MIKWALEKHPYIRHILILSYLKLQHCKFSFTNDIPKRFQIAFMKSGRNLYNNAKTHKEINTLKANVYSKYLDEDLYKARNATLVDNIRRFILVCGCVATSDQANFNVTNKTMKAFLTKLKDVQLYDGHVNLTKSQFHDTIVRQVMPKTSEFIRQKINGS